MSRAARAYRDVSLETAPPARLLDELYARLIRDMEDAKSHIAQGDLEKKGVAINHAHSIVTQLIAALDHRIAPELCARIRGLYGYVVFCLSQANMRVDSAPLTGAIDVIAKLRDGFSQASSR